MWSGRSEIFSTNSYLVKSMSETCDRHEGDLSYPCSAAPNAWENKSELRRYEFNRIPSISAMEAEGRSVGFQGSQEILRTASRISSLTSAVRIKEKLSDGLKCKTAYSSSNTQKRSSGGNLGHLKEWIESVGCNSGSTCRAPLSNDSNCSTAHSITMPSSSISASSIGSSAGSVSSVASSLSRASASIRSAGATLRTLQMQLNLLTQESHNDYCFHQTAAEMMGTHTVELNHLQQLEREAIQQAEDELRKEVIAALTANQKTLKEMRENNEYEEKRIREQLQSWRTRRRDVEQEGSYQKSKNKTKRRSKEREKEMLASVRLSTPQEPLYQNSMKKVKKEESNDVRNDKKEDEILPEKQDNTFLNSKLPKKETEKQAYRSSEKSTPLLFLGHSVKISPNTKEDEEKGRNTPKENMDQGNCKIETKTDEDEKTVPSAIPCISLPHADNSAHHLETQKEHVVHSVSTVFLCGACIACSVSAVCPLHNHVCPRCRGVLQDAAEKHLKMPSVLPSPATCLGGVSPESGAVENACCTCIPRGSRGPFHCLSSSFSCHACCCRCCCSSLQHNVSCSDALCAQGENLKHVEKSCVEDTTSSKTLPLATASIHPTVRSICSEDAVGDSVDRLLPLPCHSERMTRETVSERDHTDVHGLVGKQKEQKYGKTLKKRERGCTLSTPCSSILRDSSLPSLDYETERVVRQKKSIRKSSRPKRKKETLSFSPSRRLPPFLPCGPLSRFSPEKSTFSCFPLKKCDFFHEDMSYLKSSDGNGAPPPPPPLPASSSFPTSPLYSHHVDGVLSTAHHFNLLRPRDYYRRLSLVDGHIPVDITDTAFSNCRVRELQMEKAACRMGEEEQKKLDTDDERIKRLSKKIFVHQKETRQLSKHTTQFRKGWVGREKETQRRCPGCTPENYGRPSRRFLTAPYVAGHRSPPFRWSSLPRHAWVGRPPHTTFSSAERKRAMSLRCIMKEVHREKLYCDALHCYLQQVIHPKVITSWYSG